MAVSDQKVDALIEVIEKLADEIAKSNSEGNKSSSTTKTRNVETAEDFLHPEALENYNNLLSEKRRLQREINEEMGKEQLANADFIRSNLELLQLTEQQIQQSNRAMDTLKNPEKTFNSLTKSFGNLSSGIGNLNLSSIADGFKGISGSVKDFAQAWATGDIASIEGMMMNLGASIEKFAIEKFVEFLQKIVDLAVKFEDLERNIRKATGASAEFAKDIRGLRNDVIMAGVSADDLAESHTTLANTFTDYTMMGSQSRQEMLKVTSVLGELGASSADTAQSFQNLTKGLGMTTSAAGQTLIEIEALGKDIGVSASKMASDFNKVSNNVLKLGSKGPQAFKDLAVAAKITGLEIEKITQMTDKFDTFDGAAEQVGKLNAALGGNFVNAMDLMMTTDPAERFNMIRDSILDAGLSFEEMSYHQKQFYADSLGLSSVSDLSKALSGDMDALNGSLGENSAEMEAAEKRAQSLQTFQESLQNLFASFVPVLTPLIDALQGMAGWLSENGEMIKKVTGALLLVGGTIGLIAATIGSGGSVLIPLLATLTGGLITFGDAGSKTSKVGKYISDAFDSIGPPIQRLLNALEPVLDTFKMLGWIITEILAPAIGVLIGNFFASMGTFIDLITFGYQVISIIGGIGIAFKSVSLMYKLITDETFTLKDAFVEFIEYLLSPLESLAGAVSSFFNTWINLVNLISGADFSNVDFASDMSKNIKSFAKGAVELTPMATGGIVEGPTPALVGEAGPEAIIPLDKLQTFISPIVNNPVTQMIQQATSGMFQGGPKEITVYLTLDGKVIDKKIVDVMNQKAVDSLRGF